MRVLLSAVALSLLAGCSTISGGGSTTPAPQGVGGGPNNLRRAPCACNEIKTQPGLPGFLKDANAQSSARA